MIINLFMLTSSKCQKIFLSYGKTFFYSRLRTTNLYAISPIHSVVSVEEEETNIINYY